jgi:hypothetical protein
MFFLFPGRLFLKASTERKNQFAHTFMLFICRSLKIHALTAREKSYWNDAVGVATANDLTIKWFINEKYL